MKLLLNHDYDPVEEAKREKEEEKSTKATLVREHSRRLFTLGQLNLGQLTPAAPPALVNGDIEADKEESMEVDGDGDKKKEEEAKKKAEEEKKKAESEENLEPDGKILIDS